MEEIMERVIKKLKTENKQKKLIADRLTEQAKNEPAFNEKILNDNKSLDDCWDYINSLAKKEAVKGVAVIEKETVYGWAIHYFDEEKLEDWNPKKETEKTKTKDAKDDSVEEEKNEEKTKTKSKLPKGVSEKQISFFDL